MGEQTAKADGATTLFLSYAHVDDAAARRLIAALRQAGYTVWWDAMVEGGAAFSKSITDALDMADAVLVLWSARSIESDWVRDEAAEGRDRHRLVPLSLDGSLPPLGFRQYQTIDLTHWRGRRASHQFREIERAIATVAGQPVPSALERGSGLSRRRLLLAGTGAATVAAGGGAWLAWDKGLFGGGPDALSVAVLPFRNLSGDKAQDYFADGLTEEVRTALTRIGQLRVLAATSSERAGQNGHGLRTVAADLGVRYLLSGSVQRAADLVRISVDLVDGRTGFSRWSQRVDRRLADIFAVQSEIAALVAGAMSVQVATTRPAPGGTANVSAYEHLLRGRALFNLAKDEASDRAALTHFELAIAADPKFALARAARARSLAAIAGEYAEADQLKHLYAESIAEARRAVDLAPELAEGHLALGYAVFAGKLDIGGARSSYERAYALGHGKADIVLFYALYCSRANRPGDAASAAARAVILDPLNPRALRAQGSVAYAARRYADALAPLRRALQLNPKMSFAHSLAGSALLGLGQTADALKEFEAEPGPLFRFTGIAIAQHRLGNRAAAEQAFDQLVREVGDAGAYQQAQVLAQWGRADEAFDRLDRARSVGDSGLTYTATDPMLDPIRRDSRFVRFVNRLTV